jgi:hypothetical protein
MKEKKQRGSFSKSANPSWLVVYLGSDYVWKAQPEKVHWTRVPPVLLFPICLVGFREFTQDLENGAK